MNRRFVKCPICKGTGHVPVVNRASELKRYLSIPHKGEAREVYRADGTHKWYLTYSRDFGKRIEPFSKSDVQALIDQGDLVAAYPNSTDGYRLRPSHTTGVE